MSSALKPALPPPGAQTSTSNPSAAGNKPLTGPPGMAQHVGNPGPYTAGPLSHVASLPHSHSNMGLSNANMATNMSMNTMSNMSQMSSHVSINQTPPHTMQGGHANPMKSSGLPTTIAAQAMPHSYLPGNSAPLSSSRDDEGTTLLPSQNSAQLMAMHRAQQQQHQQTQHHHEQQSQQITTDRFKVQANLPQTNQQQYQQLQPVPPQPQQTPQLQPQQIQHQLTPPNGTVSGSTESTCSKVAVAAPATVEMKTENIPSATSVVQNHVTTSPGDRDVNTKPTENATSTSVSVTPTPSQSQTATSVEQKINTVTTPINESAPEPANQTINTPIKSTVTKEVPKPLSTMKLATTPRTTSRKRETKAKPSESPKSVASSPSKTPDGKSPGAQNNRPPDKIKTARTPSEERKSKRTRTRTQPYQSPIPELALISKLSSSTSSPSKGQDDKLIVFYKNEFLAVRNAEGGFYVCQAVQNVYKSSLRIRIRWLSQDKQDKIYIPDFYDVTDFDCILTNLNMERVEKGKYNLPKDELERTENILKRALAVEKGEVAPSLTEEHPDGLDLSLFRDESQLKKKRKSVKRKSAESLSADGVSTNNKKTKKPDKSKTRKLSKSPSSKSPLRRNNQSLEKKSVFNYNSSSVEKKDKSSRRSDGGRAERAKRRGEANSPGATKTSPVVDQKKARVLAKVALKTAIQVSAASQNKKKGDRNTPTGNGKTATSKAGTKASTRSAVSAAALTTASTSSSSSRRSKKTKK